MTKKINLLAQQEYFKRQQLRYRRGLITEEELAQGRAWFERATSRPSRVQALTPPRGAKSIRLPMDRMTELALEYLLNQDPADLDLDSPLEKTEMIRVVICRRAIQAGWKPPDEEQL